MYQICGVNCGDEIRHHLVGNIHNNIPCIPYLGWLLNYIIRSETIDKIMSYDKDADCYRFSKEKITHNWIANKHTYNPVHPISSSFSWNSLNSVVDPLSGILNSNEPIPEFPVRLANGDQPGCSGWQLIKNNYDPNKGSFDYQLKIAVKHLSERVILFWEIMNGEMEEQRSQRVMISKGKSKVSSSPVNTKGKEKTKETKKETWTTRHPTFQDSNQVDIMDATLKERSHNYNNKSIDIVLELVQGFQKNASWYVNHLRSHSEVLKVVKSVPWTMTNNECLCESMQF